MGRSRSRSSSSRDRKHRRQHKERAASSPSRRRRHSRSPSPGRGTRSRAAESKSDRHERAASSPSRRRRRSRSPSSDRGTKSRVADSKSDSGTKAREARTKSNSPGTKSRRKDVPSAPANYVNISADSVRTKLLSTWQQWVDEAENKGKALGSEVKDGLHCLHCPASGCDKVFKCTRSDPHALWCHIQTTAKEFHPSRSLMEKWDQEWKKKEAHDRDVEQLKGVSRGYVRPRPAKDSSSSGSQTKSAAESSKISDSLRGGDDSRVGRRKDPAKDSPEKEKPKTYFNTAVAALVKDQGPTPPPVPLPESLIRGSSVGGTMSQMQFDNPKTYATLKFPLDTTQPVAENPNWRWFPQNSMFHTEFLESWRRMKDFWYSDWLDLKMRDAPCITLKVTRWPIFVYRFHATDKTWSKMMVTGIRKHGLILNDPVSKQKIGPSHVIDLKWILPSNADPPTEVDDTVALDLPVTRSPDEAPSSPAGTKSPDGGKGSSASQKGTTSPPEEPPSEVYSGPEDGGGRSESEDRRGRFRPDPPPRVWRSRTQDRAVPQLHPAPGKGEPNKGTKSPGGKGGKGKSKKSGKKGTKSPHGGKDSAASQKGTTSHSEEPPSSSNVGPIHVAPPPGPRRSAEERLSILNRYGNQNRGQGGILKQEFSRALADHAPDRDSLLDIINSVLPSLPDNDRVSFASNLIKAVGSQGSDHRADLMKIAGVLKSTLDADEMVAISTRVIELFPDEIPERRRPRQAEE